MSRIRSCSGGCQSLSPDIHQNNKGPGVFINHQGHVTEHRHFGLGQVRTYHNIFAEGLLYISELTSCPDWTRLSPEG